MAPACTVPPVAWSVYENGCQQVAEFNVAEPVDCGVGSQADHQEEGRDYPDGAQGAGRAFPREDRGDQHDREP